MAVQVHGFRDELGDVVAHQHRVVEGAGVFLRQHKRFSGDAVRIDVTDVGAGVRAVVPASAEYEPAAVAAPVVVS